MAIIRKDDVTPERPVIIVLYGTPGTGKTSLATTADTPLLIDTDRGYDRAVQRVDTITAQRWQDIDGERTAMAGYKTVIVDTAKAMLDDYLAGYVCEQNFKLRTNSLKRFGQMADEFKQFVNYLRSCGADIIFVCHDKETQDGDTIKHAPDCTGQSKDLLLRIADQVGYVSKVNNRRTITFEPTDNFVGKNVAGLTQMTIPEATDARFPSFMADIIKQVKQSIQSRTEAQRKANEQVATLREMLSNITTADKANELMQGAATLPTALKRPFFDEMCKTLEPLGIVFDKATKQFVANAAA